MKSTKLFGALVALLALSAVACNGPKEEPKSEEPSSEPASAASKEESKPTESSEPAPSQPAESSKPAESSEPAQSSEAPAEDPFLQVIPHTWTEGTPAQNSSEKNYIPLTDEAAGKVGVKIAILDFTLDAPETTATGMDSSGKINPGNDHNAYIRYRIKAPKAGAYQMVMRGKSSTSNDALSKTLNDRAFAVKLNGVAVDTKGDRVVLTENQGDFVAAPTVNLTGEEDTIDVTASDYRIQFDTTGFVIFAEH